MSEKYDLERFLNAQKDSYADALKEIKNGRKRTHWMWYIFPQLKGLGRSYFAEYYGIASAEEAKAYMEHPILGNRLEEISLALLELESNDALQVMGSPDHLKLKSCMTLFAAVCPENAVFQKVLNKFFDGETDKRTRRMLQD